MPRRLIDVDGVQWAVSVSGRITQYVKDEFGLVFTSGAGAGRERRVIALFAPRRQEPRALAGRDE